MKVGEILIKIEMFNEPSQKNKLKDPQILEKDEARFRSESQLRFLRTEEMTGNLIGSNLGAGMMTQSQKILNTLNEARQFMIDAEVDRERVVQSMERKRQNRTHEGILDLQKEDAEQLPEALREHIDSIFSGDGRDSVQKGEQSPINLTDYVGRGNGLESRRYLGIKKVAGQNEIMIIGKNESDEEGRIYVLMTTLSNLRFF